MPINSVSKLEKLQILAFADRQRAQPVGVFEAMFNPDSLKLDYTISYAEIDSPGSGGQQANFVHGKHAVSPIKLVLDGTGYAPSASLGAQAQTVAGKIENFLDLCVRVNGSTHEPNFLRLQWGTGVLQGFDCRVGSASISYSLFARNGSVLRAELDINFVEDTPNKKRAQKENRSSPDVSHIRLVRSGDTLPALCEQIYGSQGCYVRVARANKLDNFRKLTPGQTLIFPPLT